MEYAKHEDGSMSLAEQLKAMRMVDVADIKPYHVALLVRSGGSYPNGATRSKRYGDYAPDENTPLVWRIFNEGWWNCEHDVEQIGLDLPGCADDANVRTALRWYLDGHQDGHKEGHREGSYQKEEKIKDAISLLRSLGIGTVVLPQGEE